MPADWVEAGATCHVWVGRAGARAVRGSLRGEASLH